MVSLWWSLWFHETILFPGPASGLCLSPPSMCDRYRIPPLRRCPCRRSQDHSRVDPWRVSCAAARYPYWLMMIWDIMGLYFFCATQYIRYHCKPCVKTLKLLILIHADLVICWNTIWLTLSLFSSRFPYFTTVFLSFEKHHLKTNWGMFDKPWHPFLRKQIATGSRCSPGASQNLGVSGEFLRFGWNPKFQCLQCNCMYVHTHTYIYIDIDI